jgi:hypothetical protein
MIPAVEGYREFLCTKDDKTIVKLSVRHPNKKELEAADMEYSGFFNQSLLGGLPTQAKMLRVLREKEVISPTDEAEMGQLTEDIRALNAQLRTDKFGDPAEKKKVEIERNIKQARLSVLNREIESMLAHTADTKANEAQRNFLIACVIEYADGNKKGDRVWEGVEGLLENKDTAMLNRVLYAYMVCQADMPDEWDTLTKSDEEPDKKDEATQPVVAQAVVDAAAPVATLVVADAMPVPEVVPSDTGSSPAPVEQPVDLAVSAS